jgi:hypothetical protein
VGFLDALRGLQHPRLEGLQDSAVHKVQDVLFGLDIAVQGADPQAAGFGNLADGGPVEPLTGKEPQRRIADLRVPPPNKVLIFDDRFDIFL